MTHISRRNLMTSTAALALGAAIGLPAIQPARAIGTGTATGKSWKSGCAELHPRMSQRLADLAKDPALSRDALSHAIKTWKCPKCGTGITSAYAESMLLTAA